MLAIGCGTAASAQTWVETHPAWIQASDNVVSHDAMVVGKGSATPQREASLTSEVKLSPEDTQAGPNPGNHGIAVNAATTRENATDPQLSHE